MVNFSLFMVRYSLFIVLWFIVPAAVPLFAGQLSLLRREASSGISVVLATTGRLLADVLFVFWHGMITRSFLSPLLRCSTIFCLPFSPPFVPPLLHPSSPSFLLPCQSQSHKLTLQKHYFYSDRYDLCGCVDDVWSFWMVG